MYTYICTELCGVSVMLLLSVHNSTVSFFVYVTYLKRCTVNTILWGSSQQVIYRSFYTLSPCKKFTFHVGLINNNVKI